MRAVLVAIVITGCASAGSPAGNPDAQVAVDAFERRDAGTGADALVNTCASTEVCTGAMMLGTVSGDTANQKLMASGHRSAWFRVRVTENDSEIAGLTLRLAAKLTSPASNAFDVFVYLNAGSDTVECSTTVGTVMTTGNVDETRAEWGEGGVANGADDGRNVSIEVRPVSTSCATSSMWQLEIEGNWN